jgi:hypothetical protein
MCNLNRSSNLISPRSRFFKETKIKLTENDPINKVFLKDSLLLKSGKESNIKIK